MRPRLILSLALPLLLAGCLADDERETIEIGLTCEDDCESRQDAVRDLGFEAIPRLGGALYGPPPERIRNVRRQAERVYGRLSPPPPGTDLNAYVTRAERNFRAQYQSSAATLLSDIGQKGGFRCFVRQCRSKATTELREAFVRDSIQRDTAGTGFYRVDVLEVIRDQLESLGDTTALPAGQVVINVLLVNPATGAIYGDTDSVEVASGVSFALESLVFDTGGRPISPAPPLVWTSSDPSVGMVTGTAAGAEVSTIDDGSTVLIGSLLDGGALPPIAEDTLLVIVPIP